jgi:hypothetical protein
MMRRRLRHPRSDRLKWTGAALVITAALLPGASGCREELGSTYACDCSFLTDFDDSSTQAVTVCAPSDDDDRDDHDRAEAYAGTCALERGAPAPVERCQCRVEKRGSGCKVGACGNRRPGE